MSELKRKQKTLIITDDEEESVKEEEELNPFSFKEFLRSKNLDLDQDLLDSEDQEQVQMCFLSNQERGWRSEGGASSGSLYTEEEEETRSESGPEVSRCSYEGDDETSILESRTETGTRTETRTSLITALKQENEALRRTVAELKEVSHKNQLRAEELSAELLQRQRQDQQEALDLETMVQSVEHNLKIMTKRALKAEATVSKLKTELKQLQAGFDLVRAENKALKAAESELVLTMRQNAQTASEKLQETAAIAHSSVRRLLSEAESLRFVSELLQSIDKMSTVH